MAHIGVIEELLAQGFRISSIVGSSMGAMVGAMYATGQLEACKDWLCTWNRRKMWQLADFAPSREGLCKGNRFIRELRQMIPDTNIEDLPLPYAALATDLKNECVVKFTKGNLFDAIRASISIPMVFRPFHWKGTLLIDGGILSPLPLRHAIRCANAKVIAVDVNAPGPGKRKRNVNPYQLLTRSSRLMMQEITRNELAQYPPDLLISMCGNDFEMMEFFRADDIIRAGREAARTALLKK